MICFLNIMLGLLFTQKKKVHKQNIKANEAQYPIKKPKYTNVFLTVSGPFAFS